MRSATPGSRLLGQLKQLDSACGGLTAQLSLTLTFIFQHFVTISLCTGAGRLHFEFLDAHTSELLF